MHEDDVIIASRFLTFRSETGDIKIPINIFAPERDDGAWKCRYEIGWPDDVWKSYGAGVDSVQALNIALEKIGIELYTSEFHKSERLIWEKPANGYGFPVAKDARDLLIGDDAKYL